MAEYDTVAIVGVGLIGGSIGLAVRERRLAGKVIGIGRRESSLDAAKKAGAIDVGTTELADGVADADLVVVSTPVDLVAKFVVEAAAVCRSGALLTDAGSTKEAIVATVDAQLAANKAEPRFVGSHPLAGDHRTGVTHARADLLAGRKVVVTPTAASDRGAVADVGAFWRALGAEVVEMRPAEHDAALAATSHLPHLVAAALAAATPAELLPLAASGWRDTTRIAGGDGELWRPIFATNRRYVLEALDRFENVASEIRAALEAGDDQLLLQVLEAAQHVKSQRDALGD